MSWSVGSGPALKNVQGGGQGMPAGRIQSNLYGPAAPGFGNTSTWHPTVAWLLAFTVAELVLYHLLSHHLSI
jgi:hypothetical protein